MLVIVPVVLCAQEPDAAMLHHIGEVLINGTPAPASSAVLANDLLQTQSQSEATLDASGTSVAIKSETLVKFQGNELSLDHGTLLIDTSKGMRVRVGCLTLVPATSAWTQYDVTDKDGRVTVAAHKSDININHPGVVVTPKNRGESLSRNTVREGEQKTYEEKCTAAGSPAQVAQKVPLLNTSWAKAAGLALIGIPSCWALCRGTDDPVSPFRP